MSKMSRLNLQLQEQAEELGFSTTQEALDAGYGIDYDKAKLVEPEEAAHEAWLKEKEEVLEELESLYLKLETDGEYVYANIINDAIKFIEGVSHE